MLKSPFAAILLIMVIISGANLTAAQAALSEREFMQVEPETVVKAAAAAAQFTPAIEENIEEVARITDGSQNGVLKKPDVTETALSVRSHTIQKGETISTIAEKYELTVATILESNNLHGQDTTNVHPGQVLNIPPENTSTSLVWLQEEQKVRQERERKAREAAQKRQIASAQSRRVAFRSSSREAADGGFSGESEGSFITPIRHNGVSRCRLRYHPGTDYRADVGTPVVASASGRVIETTGGWGHGFGISVLVDHGGVQTRYAHLSRIAAGVGESVGQGEVIGYSGNSGFSTGPHLHFEKVVGGRAVASIC